jgi:hypothetical protein
MSVLHGTSWGSVPQRVPLITSVFAQFAGTFINRITSVKIGGMATNVRFLQKNGIDTSVAVAGVGVSSVGTFIVHMSLLIMSVVFIGRNAGDFVKLPSGNAVLIGLVVLFTLAGLVWFLPVGRKVFKTKVWPILKLGHSPAHVCRYGRLRDSLWTGWPIKGSFGCRIGTIPE